jgi:hypothetical protein
MRLVEQIGSGIPRIINPKRRNIYGYLNAPKKSREKIKAIIKDNPNLTTIGISESEKRGYY